MTKYTELTEQQEKEAKALYLHLLNHPEVQQSSRNAGMPICKMCGRSARDILEEVDDDKIQSET